MTALAVFLAGGILHDHAAAWWPAALAAATAGTGLLAVPHTLLSRRPAGARAARFLARMWAGCGINRAAERAYAAAVTAGAGSWLSAAVAAGPGRKPLPVLAAVLTLLLGVPWWAHRRRRAKVRVEATVGAWDGIADDIGLSGSRIASVTVDAWGWTARVILKRGTTTAAAIAKIPEIRHRRPARKRPHRPRPRAGAQPVPAGHRDRPPCRPVPWPGTAPGGSITRPVPVGVSGQGRTVTVTLLRRNALVGGTTGAGKSGLLNVIIAALAPAVTWCCGAWT
jgi:S-DNA-T family DNA segregation ATPase FtsK/SpoIIIE